MPQRRVAHITGLWGKVSSNILQWICTNGKLLGAWKFMACANVATAASVKDLSAVHILPAAYILYHQIYFPQQEQVEFQPLIRCNIITCKPCDTVLFRLNSTVSFLASTLQRRLVYDLAFPCFVRDNKDSALFDSHHCFHAPKNTGGAWCCPTVFASMGVAKHESMHAEFCVDLRLHFALGLACYLPGLYFLSQ